MSHRPWEGQAWGRETRAPRAPTPTLKSGLKNRGDRADGPAEPNSDRDEPTWALSCDPAASGNAPSPWAPGSSSHQVRSCNPRKALGNPVPGSMAAGCVSHMPEHLLPLCGPKAPAVQENSWRSARSPAGSRGKITTTAVIDGYKPGGSRAPCQPGLQGCRQLPDTGKVPDFPSPEGGHSREVNAIPRGEVGTLPAQSLWLTSWGGLRALTGLNDLLSLELVGGYDVCNWHDLLFVNRKEVLWDVLKKRRQGHRLTHTEEEKELGHSQSEPLGKTGTREWAAGADPKGSKGSWGRAGRGPSSSNTLGPQEGPGVISPAALCLPCDPRPGP